MYRFVILTDILSVMRFENAIIFKMTVFDRNARRESWMRYNQAHL